MSILCNPGAIHPTQREAHAALAEEIFTMVLDVQERESGYAFRLPAETPMLYKLAQFIANERLCCPFFTFTITVNDALWLELSGGEGVKALIQVDILKIIETGNFPKMDDLEAAYIQGTAK